MTDELLHGAAAIADYLSVRRSQVYTLVKSNRLPIWNEGVSVLSTKRLIDEWLEDNRKRARAATMQRELEDA